MKHLHYAILYFSILKEVVNIGYVAGLRNGNCLQRYPDVVGLATFPTKSDRHDDRYDLAPDMGAAIPSSQHLQFQQSLSTECRADKHRLVSLFSSHHSYSFEI